jgi:molecular chaperone HtpG
MNTSTANTEVRKFDAEVGKVLNLMINSLYTNKDIFLRELISNASDACDKLRYEANKQPDLLKDSNLKITLTLNQENKELIIRDNGIGMSKQELIENLGTIARSGTQGFLEQLTGDKTKDVQMIGQFGVGFYSSFMIAEEVIVKSSKAGEKETWVWLSKGTGEFTVTKSDESMPSGTEIRLKLKEGEEIYVDKFRIQHIINTYSDHISIPIELVEKDKTETINSSSALWTKSKSEINKDEYKAFYKKISSSGDTPWVILHNKNEGVVEYTNLLFIPSVRTFDLFHPDRRRRIKLYIKRVFINDEGVDIIPPYLRFLRGIIDSEDLPLNISRESLQHNNVLQKIKKSIVKRVLSELASKLKDDREAYVKFWNNFGPALKEGLCENLDNKDDLLNICLFKSLKSNKFITLDEYIATMQKDQDSIYYISGEDEERLRTHPQLEGFINKGLDVLLFTDSVDDFWVNVNHQYKEKMIKSVSRADINLEKTDDNKEKKDDSKESNKTTLTDYCKKTLGSLVQDVRISKKLTESPACLAVAEGAMDIRMERFLRDQNQLHSSTAKILEINANHKIVEFIAEKVSADKADASTETLVKMLFDQACVIEGEPVSDSAGFVKRLNDIMCKAI